MNELTALRNLYDQVRRMTLTAPVDDDSPEVMHDLHRAFNAAGGLINTTPDGLNLIEHLDKQIAWSAKTFGVGERTEGIIDHIKKELDEVSACPGDLSEWIDIVILAFDGAWRAAHTAEDIAAMLSAKHKINVARKWPDWRNAEPGKAIEHIKEIQMHCPVLKDECKFYTYQFDSYGEVAIDHCTHPLSPVDTEGNCTTPNCPLMSP